MNPVEAAKCCAAGRLGIGPQDGRWTDTRSPLRPRQGSRPSGPRSTPAAASSSRTGSMNGPVADGRGNRGCSRSAAGADHAGRYRRTSVSSAGRPMPGPTAFSTGIAVPGDSEALPFAGSESGTRRTPGIRAAAATLKPSSSRALIRMKVPGCGGHPRPDAAVGHRYRSSRSTHATRACFTGRAGRSPGPRRAPAAGRAPRRSGSACPAPGCESSRATRRCAAPARSVKDRAAE